MHTLVWLDADTIKEHSTPRFLELRELWQEQHRNRTAEGPGFLQKLYRPLHAHILQKTISKCDPKSLSDFLEAACGVVRLAASLADQERTPAEGSTVVPRSVGLVECCTWLCSLCAVGNASADLAKTVATTWIYVNFVIGGPAESDDPQDFLERLTTSLSPLRVEQAHLVRCGRTEFVLRVSNDLSKGRSVSTVAKNAAASWCAELVATEHAPDDLKEAATVLGVALAEPSTPRKDAGSFVPVIFDGIRRLPEPELASEWAKCLDLVFAVPEEVLAEQTVHSIASFTYATRLDDAAKTLYFAARQLWDHYARTGVAEHLGAGRTFSEFVYSVQSLPGVDPKLRANALYLPLFFQLPNKIKKSPDLALICKEVSEFFRAEGCDCNPKVVLKGVLEAVAGWFRAAEGAGNKDLSFSIVMLLETSYPQLRQELDRCGGPRGDEVTLIEYLDSCFEEDHIPDIDPVFVELVKGADHEAVHTYLQKQIEQVRTALERKLTHHQLSANHLLEPSEHLFQSRGPKGELLPAFAAGLRQLEAKDFARAAQSFGQILSFRNLTITHQNIARDWLSYAYALMGSVIEARPLLRELSDSDCHYASVYWNLACIESDRQAQLAALVKGLERSPHPYMLQAAVYLGVLLDRRDDEQSRSWLALLPFREAITLQYFFEGSPSVEDDNARRRQDELLKRIYAYISQDDPVLPDPTNKKVDLSAIKSLRGQLRARDHLQVLGFWLRCRAGRRPTGDMKTKTDYWAEVTDIWASLGEDREAARAFGEELDCRLQFLGWLLEGGKTPHPNAVKDLLTPLERRLRTCMRQDLKQLGQGFYDRVVGWERVHKMTLLPNDGPRRDIHEFYGKMGDKLDMVLGRVSAAVMKSLHDITDYPRHRTAVIELTQELENAGKLRSSQTLRNLSERWDAFRQATDAKVRQTLASEVQAALSPLKVAFDEELSGGQCVMGNSIINAITRVNGKLLPGPKLSLAAVPEAQPTFLGDGKVSSFSVRVSSERGSSRVRITQAVACMKDSGQTFRLLDDLDVVPVLLQPDRTVVLTFEDDGVVKATGTCELEIQLRYDYSGQNLFSPSLPVRLTTTSRTRVSLDSPYVFGQEITPDEIVGRFFGRDEERSKVLGLLMNPLSPIAYIEGIRRTGKTSLFNCIRHYLSTNPTTADAEGRRLIPVHLKGGGVESYVEAGRVLFWLLSRICEEPEIAAAGVAPPDLSVCFEDMSQAYASFEEQLRKRLPESRVVAFWDDFQCLIGLAQQIGVQNPSFLSQTRGLLNILRDHRGPASPIVWLLAGFRPQVRLIQELSNVNLLAELEPIPLGFLGVDHVRDIVVTPLAGSPIQATSEAVSRIYDYTQGNPEVVQRMAAIMLAGVLRENRRAMTPADADSAAREIANMPAVFADTWCCVGELSQSQESVIVSFFNAVPKTGECIEQHRLIGRGESVEKMTREIDDLVLRKILTRHSRGQISVAAPVLEMWMRKYFSGREPRLMAAVFIDIANLTDGKGHRQLELANETVGDIAPGTFDLKTVLDAIDGYASDLVPTPIPRENKWVVNFPPGSVAVQVASLNDYCPVNIPKHLMEKAWRQGQKSDDTYLIDQMLQFMTDHPAVTHVVLCTGDQDFLSAGVERNISRGKTVHILTRRRALAGAIARVAQQHPQACKIVYLEDLLQEHLSQAKK